MLKFWDLTKLNSAVVYDEHVAHNCKVFTMECSKFLCIHYPGYAVKDVFQYYSLSKKKEWCLMSKITGKYLYVNLSFVFAFVFGLFLCCLDSLIIKDYILYDAYISKYFKF